MRRKVFLQQKVALVAVGFIAIATLAAVPVKELKAAALKKASFKQEIKVEDITDHLHEKGISVPEISFRYVLDPVWNDANLPSARYQTDKAKFPAPTNPPDGSYKVLTTDLDVTAGVSNENGIVTEDVNLLDTDNANGLFAGKVFGEANKVYRYEMSISKIVIGAASTLATGDDIRSLDNGLFAGGDAKLYVDVDVDQDGNIRAIVLHTDVNSTSEDDKVEGYVYSSDLALQYNVYDLVVTSNYVGNTSNYDASAMKYTVTLGNLPTYLTQANIFSVISAGTETEEFPGENRQNWAQAASAPADGAEFNGGLSYINGVQTHVTFPGIPVVGKDGTPVTFNAVANYHGLTNAATFNTSIYAGGNATPLSADITSLELFTTSAIRSDYGNIDDVTLAKVDVGENTATLVSSAVMQASSSPDANNVRFLIFDPNQLILVGVVVHALPGIILVGAAAVGGVLLLRRRREE